MGLNATGVTLSLSEGRSSPPSASGHFCSMIHRLLNLLLLGSCHQSKRKIRKRKQHAGTFNRETGPFVRENNYDFHEIPLGLDDGSSVEAAQ